jgi:thiamine-monophosphate kinase
MEALKAKGGFPQSGPLRAVIRRHLRPVPPLSWAMQLAESGLASAAMDLSDGLSIDLGRLCRESEVGAEIETALLPVRPGTGKAAVTLGLDAETAALHGGEEYELLFTVSPGKANAVERRAAGNRGTRITRIGTIIERRKVFAVSPERGREPLIPRGWKHF